MGDLEFGMRNLEFGIPAGWVHQSLIGGARQDAKALRDSLKTKNPAVGHGRGF